MPIKIGVIGCGTIAYWGHLRSLQRLRGATLAAAADPDPAARARAAGMVHGPMYGLATDLLQADIDAVIISVPPQLHAELTIAAARAGKHVYVEKPLATTADDAREVVAVVAESGVIAAVGFNYRHHPAHVRARALLKRGGIGQVRAVQTVFCEPGTRETMPEWKQRRHSGGGALLDLASHHIDLLRWFLDDELAIVDARIASIETEHDSATLNLTTRGGIDVQTYVSFRAGPADFLEFIGEGGTLRVDRHALTPMLKTKRLTGVRPAVSLDVAINRARHVVGAPAREAFLSALVPSRTCRIRPTHRRPFGSTGNGRGWGAKPRGGVGCGGVSQADGTRRGTVMQSPLRVLLITDWMPRHGGAEIYASTVRAGLTAAGDEVRLLTSSAGSAADGTADFVAYGTERVAAQAVLQVVNPFAKWRTQEAVRAFRPDVALVHLFAYHLSPAALWPLRDVPTAMMVLDYKVVCPLGSKLLPTGQICEKRAGIECWRSGCLTLPHWIRDQARYAVIKPVVKNTNLVFACSRHVQRELHLNGTESTYLPLPIAAPDPSFSRTAASHPEFVFCGRLSVEKGLPLLVRAFARLHSQMPSAHLKIVGDGPLRPGIEALVHAHRLTESVTFTGWLDQRGVDRQLESAWALVAPAIWAEPLGLVALEAIVRGVPVIASQTGGLGESVEAGVSGLLFPNGDEDALYGALARVATEELFPSRSLPAAVIAHAVRTFDVTRHIVLLRTHLQKIASRVDG